MPVSGAPDHKYRKETFEWSENGSTSKDHVFPLTSVSWLVCLRDSIVEGRMDSPKMLKAHGYIISKTSQTKPAHLCDVTRVHDDTGVYLCPNHSPTPRVFLPRMCADVFIHSFAPDSDLKTFLLRYEPWSEQWWSHSNIAESFEYFLTCSFDRNYLVGLSVKTETCRWGHTVTRSGNSLEEAGCYISVTFQGVTLDQLPSKARFTCFCGMGIKQLNVRRFSVESMVPVGLVWPFLSLEWPCSNTEASSFSLDGHLPPLLLFPFSKAQEQSRHWHQKLHLNAKIPRQTQFYNQST